MFNNWANIILFFTYIIINLIISGNANERLFDEFLNENTARMGKVLDKGHIDSAYIPYKVWLEWDKSEHRPAQIGVLLYEDIVLTSFAKPGKVVYGLSQYTKDPPRVNTVKYKLLETYKGDDDLPQSLTIVRLQRNLQSSVSVNFIQIPSAAPPPEGEVCGMVTVGRQFNEFSEVLAVIKPPTACEKTHKLREKDICVDLRDKGRRNRTHCNQFYDGSSLICDDKLICIAAAITPCNEDESRICMSVFHYSDWIKKAIKRIRELDDDEDPLFVETAKGYHLKPLGVLYIFIANICLKST